MGVDELQGSLAARAELAGDEPPEVTFGAMWDLARTPACRSERSLRQPAVRRLAARDAATALDGVVVLLRRADGSSAPAHPGAVVTGTAAQGVPPEHTSG